MDTDWRVCGRERDWQELNCPQNSLQEITAPLRCCAGNRQGHVKWEGTLEVLTAVTAHSAPALPAKSSSLPMVSPQGCGLWRPLHLAVTDRLATCPAPENPNVQSLSEKCQCPGRKP